MIICHIIVRMHAVMNTDMLNSVLYFSGKTLHQDHGTLSFDTEKQPKQNPTDATTCQP